MAKNLNFRTIGNSTYPKSSKDGDEDQSYGFVEAFKLQTGNTRGTQTVGYGGAQIDGANNRITVTDTTSADGNTVGIGNIPNNNTVPQYGFFTQDSSGQIIQETIDGTLYYYNPDDNFNNSIIVGAYNGRTGIWVTKPGYDAKEELA